MPKITLPNGATLNHFGVLHFGQTNPLYKFGEDAFYIFVGTCIDDLLKSVIPPSRYVCFCANECPLDKQTLMNAAAFGLNRLEKGEKNLVILCDAGQKRSRIVCELIAKNKWMFWATTIESPLDELSEGKIDFFKTLNGADSPHRLWEQIADFLHSQE